MPFTISHAAAALPVKALNKRLPLSALMVGSMAPDFAYFLPWDIGRHDTHTLAGMFTFGLPAGLIAWLYYVLILERPTLGVLPDAWRTRVPPTAALDAGALLVASIAVLLGAATHLAWDAFTHSAPLANVMPVLRDDLIASDGTYLPVYFVLQVVSSVLGLVALATWAWRIRNRPAVPRDQIVELMPRVSNDERYLAVLFLGVACVAGGFLGAAREGSLFLMLIGMMSGIAVGWSALAVAIRFRSRTLRIFTQTDSD